MPSPSFAIAATNVSRPKSLARIVRLLKACSGQAFKSGSVADP
jgi:hypothetical protein